MLNCVKVKFWFITRHLFYSLKQSAFPTIIKCYLRSAEVNITLKVTDFTGTLYIFHMHSFIQPFENYTGEEYAWFKSIAKLTACYQNLDRKSFSRGLNLLECCNAHVVLYSNLETLQQCYLIPLKSFWKLQVYLYESASFVSNGRMKGSISVACSQVL